MIEPSLYQRLDTWISELGDRRRDGQLYPRADARPLGICTARMVFRAEEHCKKWFDRSQPNFAGLRPPRPVRAQIRQICWGPPHAPLGLHRARSLARQYSKFKPAHFNCNGAAAGIFGTLRACTRSGTGRDPSRKASPNPPSPNMRHQSMHASSAVVI